LIKLKKKNNSSIGVVESIVTTSLPQSLMEKKQKYARLEGDAQKHILRFLRDENGANHKLHFDKRQHVFGSEHSPFRVRCNRFYRDTRRRVHSNPEKWKSLLAKHGLDKEEEGEMARKSATKTKKGRNSDDDDDDDDDSTDGEEVEEVGCVFVGSPTPKKQQQQSSQKKAAKNKETGNDSNGEWSGAG
jgi:hypothetical protein